MSKTFLSESAASRAAFFAQERERLDYLAREGQSPEVLFIGCSDSRVLAESLTGARPGDLFVVRVVANIVPPPDSGENGVAAAIEFAVDVLKVKRIIVCGHTDCGGLRALEKGLGPDAPEHTRAWLEHAQPALDDLAHKGLTGAALHDALVEQNVVSQLFNVRAYSAVSEAEARGEVKVHGWVFDLHHRRMRYYDQASEAFVTFEP